MKNKLIPLVLLLVVHTGCVKSNANEERAGLAVNFHDQQFGRSAAHLLKDDQFQSLKVEIQYMTGFQPDLGAVVHLEKFLNQHLHKPGGISIVTTEIGAVGDSALRRKDVLAIEKANRQYFSYGNEICLYILYSNNEFINPKILGEAYRNTSAVLYGKSIREHTGKIGKPNRTKLEATILLHEMGHLLGLVNKGTGTTSEHADPAHASHCRNRDCLMYWANGLEDKFGHLVRGAIPGLDTACLADLKAAGGR